MPLSWPRLSASRGSIDWFAAGIAPALYETRRLHANPLCAISTSDRVRQRWRHALVVLEITVTIALLVVTSSMVEGFQRARAARLGFRTTPLLSARVENPGGVPATQVVDVVSHLPGVAAAAAATSVPLAAFGPRERAASDAAGSNAIVVERATISSAFFSVLVSGNTGLRRRARARREPADWPRKTAFRPTPPAMDSGPNTGARISPLGPIAARGPGRVGPAPRRLGTCLSRAIGRGGRSRCDA